MFIKRVTTGLNFPGTIKSFDIKEHFSVKQDPIQISYIGENIKKFFWGRVISPIGRHDISAYLLGEKVSTRGLIDHFGDMRGYSFPIAWHFMLDQPRGESGFLQTDGMTNIFLDSSLKSSFSIGVFRHYKGWVIRAYPMNIEPQRCWFSNNQVIVLD
jgi:hypothetical protein